MKSEKGQGLIEYALILLFVAIVVIVIGNILKAFVVVVLLPWITSLVAGILVLDPTSIATALVIIFILWLIFHRKRR